MTPHLSFLLIDALAIFTILVLGAGILKSAPRNVSAWIFALITFNTACFQLWSRHAFAVWIPVPYQIDIGSLRIPIEFLMNSTPGLFMVLCFTLFRDEEAFPRWLVVLFAVQIALDTPSPYLASSNGTALRAVLFNDVPALLQLMFVGLGLYWTAKDWRNDVVETRRLLRIMSMAVFGVMTFGVTLAGRLLIPPGIESFYFHEGYNVVCVALNSAFIFALLNAESLQRSALVTRAAPALALPETVVDRDFDDFDRAMRERHLYREPGLSIAVLALKLSIPEYRLRRLINVKLGYRNFNAMLNHYRVDEAAVALTDPARQDTPILTIALTAGYQSINPFNRAFRELRGMTPSDFRRQALAKT